MDLAVLVDFGSTFTKAAVVEWESGGLVAAAQAPTTATSDMLAGLNQALGQLEPALAGRRRHLFRACSSAAGGLRMVAVGLVPELTVAAANQAALGAGAKVLATFAFKLSQGEARAIADLRPDLLLLAGGTDGGDEQVLLHNSRALAALPEDFPIVVAGNKVVAEEAAALLAAAGKSVRLTENVLPALDRLNVEPVRQAIGELFMARIVQGKGLQQVAAQVDGPIVPTPMAVLNAARLLADGGGSEPGLGELMVVDVGGATTDVHSIGRGAPTRPGVLQRGLPPPYAMRTVDGDLGVRWNAPTIVERMAGVPGAGAEEMAARLASAVHFLPTDEPGKRFDVQLARAATALAVGRHAGRLETVYTPQGPLAVQYGKDLTGLPSLIGTGGVFRHGLDAAWILSGGCHDPEEPETLRPRQPQLFIDLHYVLAAAGLLGEVNPGAAVRLMRSSLQALDQGQPAR